jgi:hypothetical protein
MDILLNTRVITEENKEQVSNAIDKRFQTIELLEITKMVEYALQDMRCGHNKSYKEHITWLLLEKCKNVTTVLYEEKRPEFFRNVFIVARYCALDIQEQIFRNIFSIKCFGLNENHVLQYIDMLFSSKDRFNIRNEIKPMLVIVREIFNDSDVLVEEIIKRSVEFENILSVTIEKLPVKKSCLKYYCYMNNLDLIKRCINDLKVVPTDECFDMLLKGCKLKDEHDLTDFISTLSNGGYEFKEDHFTRLLEKNMIVIGIDKYIVLSPAILLLCRKTGFYEMRENPTNMDILCRYFSGEEHKTIAQIKKFIKENKILPDIICLESACYACEKKFIRFIFSINPTLVPNRLCFEFIRKKTRLTFSCLYDLLIQHLPI